VAYVLGLNNKKIQNQSAKIATATYITSA